MKNLTKASAPASVWALAAAGICTAGVVAVVDGRARSTMGWAPRSSNRCPCPCPDCSSHSRVGRLPHRCTANHPTRTRPTDSARRHTRALVSLVDPSPSAQSPRTHASLCKLAHPHSGRPQPWTREGRHNDDMAYDEQVAQRIRDLVQDDLDVTEKRMFGGLAFLVNGNMSISASGKGGLMVRLDEDEAEQLLEQDGVRPFEMRGQADEGVAARRRGGVRQRRAAARVGRAQRGVRPHPPAQVGPPPRRRASGSAVRTNVHGTGIPTHAVGPESSGSEGLDRARRHDERAEQGGVQVNDGILVVSVPDGSTCRCGEQMRAGERAGFDPAHRRGHLPALHGRSPGRPTAGAPAPPTATAARAGGRPLLRRLGGSSLAPRPPAVRRPAPPHDRADRGDPGGPDARRRRRGWCARSGCSAAPPARWPTTRRPTPS